MLIFFILSEQSLFKGFFEKYWENLWWQYSAIFNLEY